MIDQFRSLIIVSDVTFNNAHTMEQVLKIKDIHHTGRTFPSRRIYLWCQSGPPLFTCNPSLRVQSKMSKLIDVT